MENEKEKASWKTYFELGEMWGYFTRVFKKPDPDKPNSFNLRVMHGINKVSILMFLMALIVMLFRVFTR